MAREFGFEPSTNPPYYFISYNSQDSARVAAVCREMNRRCVPMWYDRGLLSGEKWEKQITTHIRNCDAVIMFITNKLMERENPYVYTEFVIAKKFNKKIHVVMLDDVKFEDVSDDLKGWFVNIETLHGVYPQPDASPADVVDLMERFIPFFIVQSSPTIKEEKQVNDPRKKSVSYPVSVGYGSVGNGVIGALLGALTGAIPYVIIKEFVKYPRDNTDLIKSYDFLWLSVLPIGLLAVLFYNKLNGLRSIKTGMTTCLSVSTIVALIFVLPQAIYLHSFTAVLLTLLFTIVGCLSMKGVLSKYINSPIAEKDLLEYSTEGTILNGIKGAIIGALIGSILFDISCFFVVECTEGGLYYAIWPSLSVGIFTVIFYKKYNGKPSKGTMFGICALLSYLIIPLSYSAVSIILKYALPTKELFSIVKSNSVSDNIARYYTWNHPSLGYFVLYSICVGPVLGVLLTMVLLNNNFKKNSKTE